jgi:hypothetical protein
MIIGLQEVPEFMVEQHPHRAMNLRSAAIEASVMRSPTSSICTVLIVKHTKMATYTLIWGGGGYDFFALLCRRARNSLTLVKRRGPVIRASGKSPIM